MFYHVSRYDIIQKPLTDMQLDLDGCIVWNADNTVFGSTRPAICAQAVYFLRSTRPTVTSGIY